jgi:toxin FitB
VIILDTNVVSELMKPSPDARVVSWVSNQPAASLFITAITEAELRYGIGILSKGQRRAALATALDALLAEDFAERILPFDSPATVAYAQLASERRRLGHPISQFDAQIAAIASSHGTPLATRNVVDFENCGITIINPWK